MSEIEEELNFQSKFTRRFLNMQAHPSFMSSVSAYKNLQTLLVIMKRFNMDTKTSTHNEYQFFSVLKISSFNGSNFSMYTAFRLAHFHSDTHTHTTAKFNYLIIGIKSSTRDFYGGRKARVHGETSRGKGENNTINKLDLNTVFLTKATWP